MKAYIDRYRDAYGVEPICKVLQMAPSCYRRHAAQIEISRAQPAFQHFRKLDELEVHLVLPGKIVFMNIHIDRRVFLH